MPLKFGQGPRKPLTVAVRAGLVLAVAAATLTGPVLPSVFNWSDSAHADFHWQKHESCLAVLPLVAGECGWSESDLVRARELIGRGTINHSDLGAAGVMKWPLQTLVDVKRCSLSKDQKDREWLRDNGFTAAALAWGAGFGGDTATPAAIGSAGAGYTAVPVARWDRVMYDLVSGTAYVGVVAFHYNGIARVRFSINGGAWTDVTSMTLNPDTGVWGYRAEIDTTTAPADGVYEMRAIAEPETRGQCVVLQGDLGTDWSTNKRGRHGYWLACNNGGTLVNTAKYVNGTTGSNTTGDGSSLLPYATVEKAATILNGPGRIIIQAAGNYAFGDGTAGVITLTQRWLTIEADSGLGATDVVFTTGDTAGVGATHVKLKNVRLALSGNLKARHIWLDGVTNDPNAVSTSDTLINSTYSYFAAATNSVSTRCRNGLRSIAHAVGCTYHHMSGACMGSTGFTANQDIYYFENYGFHGDAFHWFNFSTTDTPIPTSPPAVDEDSDTNVIVWGVEAFEFGETALFIQVQGSGTAPNLTPIDGVFFNNFAFVNFHISDDGHGTVPRNSYNWADCDHGLYWFLTCPDQNFALKADDFDPDLTVTNMSIRRCVWYSAGALPTNETYTVFDRCHFRTGATRGTNATGGDAGFYAYAASTAGTFATRRANYYPDPDGPLAGIAETAFVPIDAEGVARTNTGSSGAYETTAESPTYNPMPQKPALADTGYRPYAWQVDGETSLAESALYLWHLNEGSGDTAEDLVGGKTLDRNTGASGTWTTTGAGAALTNPVWKTGSGAITAQPSYPFTMMAVVIAPDQSSSGGAICAFDNTTSNSSHTAITLNSGAVACRDGASAANASIADDLTNGSFYTIFAVFRSSTDRSIYYYDQTGALVNSANGSVAASAVSVNAFTVGHQEDDGVYNTRFIDEILMVAVFDTEASSAQRAAAALNPFDIITDPPDVTFEIPADTIVELYDFGEITSITDNEITITIRNCSGSTLTGVSASVSGTDFEITTQPSGTINVLATSTIVITALTESNGVKSATLTLSHSGTDSPQTFALTSDVSGVTEPQTEWYSAFDRLAIPLFSVSNYGIGLYSVPFLAAGGGSAIIEPLRGRTRLNGILAWRSRPLDSSYL